MISLSSLRSSVLKNNLLVGAFCLFFFGIAAFAGLIHNHADDPFHLNEHNSCPVSIWAHTPFASLVVSPNLVFSIFVLTALFLAAISFPKKEYLFASSPRAPPAFSS